MLSKDVLFDSPFGIVKIWEPERQFSHPNGGAIQSMPVTIKAVIVESWAGGWSPGEVVRMKPFELRLRGFHIEDAMKTIPPDEDDGGMAILHDLLQEEKHEKRDELLSRYILKLHDREMDRRAALFRTRQVALICTPHIPDERARELFREVWDAVEPEDTPVLRTKDLLFIARKEIAELKSEIARLKTITRTFVLAMEGDDADI